MKNGESRRGGKAGYISWTRLERQLRKAGELREGEEITKIKASKDGVRYYVE